MQTISFLDLSKKNGLRCITASKLKRSFMNSCGYYNKNYQRRHVDKSKHFYSNTNFGVGVNSGRCLNK
ncbi:hypothetical protein COU00_00465 [Candidatus Falkowbacteria bacterium CG10_big_fil_rev_8_21_14_0_10_43_11]|uniref:Uncharacterized protein n=1 Tax=Candidatus Falkowbacteria bacterium CG10_big_fil_rev_8_21_14_0_10_43_11 TaxID=1974568 RepID=A0A2M6WMX5_9BACT|nr:MAG: hypothetical protein COU00_00465 [Candidatus Falkowbacteria bacterium CG10_big_fil_rev_8_21_14_0_10_43_11]